MKTSEIGIARLAALAISATMALSACGGGSASTDGSTADASAGGTSQTSTGSSATNVGTNAAVCADEYGVCTFSGTLKVRYGVASNFVEGTFTNSVTCGNSSFGTDPAPGENKTCWIDDSSTGSDATTTSPTVVAATTPATSTSTSTPASGTSVSFTSTTADFPNPERGFYIPVKDGEMTVSTLNGFVNQYNTRLLYYRIPLDAYRSTATLPQSFLDTLNTRFAAGRSAGVKFVVIASYNDDSSGADAPLSLVLGHIAQLKSVLTTNADVIPLLKAGLIGAYGEWWGSTNGLDSSNASRAAIKDALLANVPASTIVHFTASGDLANWWPNDPAKAAANRVGFHNDCMFASNTDGYQFPGGLSDPMRDYVKKMSAVTSYGGETCDNISSVAQARMSCAAVLSEGPAYHLSWLNKGYSPAFIQTWQSQGCLDEVSRSMGYRLQLDNITAPPSTSRGSTVTVTVNLRNVGWNRMYAARQLKVTLRHKSSGALISGSAGNLSTIASSGGTSSISVNVALPSGAATGDYDVLLSAPDIWSTTASDPRFAVRFANADTSAQKWDASTARFSSGLTLTVN